MIKHDMLPCNVKFMIEGEEEIGSPSLAKFCEENKEMLHSDVILVSDTSLIDNDTPSITTGLRGISYVEVKVTGPNKDLHSGVYGGGVANPINVLCDMIAQLQDENNKITIDGFYDDVVIVSNEERESMAKAPFSLEEYKKSLDVDDVMGEEGYSTLERTSIRPSLDVNGIWGGFTGKGTKTVLPAKAHAKISMRLVPNQDPEKIAKLFESHFKKIAPKSVKVEVQYLHGGYSTVTPVDTPEYKAAAMAMEESFGKNVIPVRSGGSIPIIALFEKILGVKSVLMGFGLDSDAIHSPNEHYGLFNFFKGIETIPYYYKYYKELKS
jgi:acetylornithine deacetylase/succinyl-diaminopimelate desuccinylase-like protein